VNILLPRRDHTFSQIFNTYAAGRFNNARVTTPAPELQNPLAGGGDNCPNCGASLASDQRYCLACGQRRGDPRLPFMDAVVFMESSKHTPQPKSAAAPTTPPSDRRPFVSANASLVAGVATLVLAIGVGVLIGRSGDNGSSNAANTTPQIIRVGGGEGGEVASTGKAKENKGSTNIGGGGGSKSATKKKAKAKTEQGKSGASKATEEVYEPAPGVKIAPPEQKIGGECDPSVAGCGKDGKFEGNFFE
jgi:hypothetical protein